ncbi:phosphate ABC transporter substrate-binding protein, PhoT family [Syntrophus gentianae]|uniref:Phosphate-binding protein n=1 Tax=Syntrophus gentianae TaxID=43775 RepID=A0A1H7YVH9_9BACT|nr:phosphate ABC transporter substrate-binding protein [Syntrophus gentianae]SEM50232.1 phosphate ABC transporter substrate-binding protein, PhoT family [Syntrophus gentianae]
MKKNPIVIFLAVIFSVFIVNSFVIAGELDAFKGQKGTLKISGGTAHIPVMKEAAQRIMSAYPDIQISIAAGGSGVGIKQVGEGLVNIGNTGRKPTDDEIARYSLKLYQWALDGVGVVVHPKNKVKGLSKAQVADIYAGKISNWKEVGGESRKINLYTRDEASGTREVFWEKALNKGVISPSANVVVSNGAMKSAVAQDPYGIGYVSVGHIDRTVTPVALDGVVPTIQTVIKGSYKISRGLYSNTKGEPTGLTKAFIDYLYTPEGRKIIQKHGFIPFP